MDRPTHEVLSGLAPAQSGTFHTMSDGNIAVIPADRQHVGLIPSLALYENLALHPALRAQCKKPLRFDWQIAQQRTLELMEKFDVRAPQTREILGLAALGR